MPKISGPNIAEHVEAQEAAVFDAATRLFADLGVANVSMGAIAREVGLARSSLYRYYPTKAAIVHRWFEAAITPLIDDSERIAQSDLPRTERFRSWVERQIDFLAEPANHAMIRASIETDEFTAEERASIGERHKDLYASLASIITNADDADDVVTRARILLIVGVLRNHSELSTAGIPDPIARAEVVRAAALIAELE